MGGALLLVLVKRWLGKFQAESYSMFGEEVLFRLHAATVLYKVAGVAFLDALMGTRWAAWYVSALGARLGQDVYLESLPTVQTDLLSLGDRTCVGQGAQMVSYTVENGCLDFLDINVAADVTVGPRAYVMPSGTLEQRSAVGALSVLAKGETVVAGDYAEGAPLVHLGQWYNPDAPKPGPDPEHAKVVENMQHDAQLPEGICPSNVEPLPTKQGPPEVVLLTGATGFVGAFILRELLRPERGVKKVYCLVRAKSPAEGAERIRKQMLHLELCTGKEWKKQYESRVVALPGDLGAPALGLTAATVDMLANEVDVVINNGAYVNVTKGYESMRAANASSVLELLKLCAGGSTVTPLHQISTVGTLPRVSGMFVREDFSTDDPSYLGSGYDQSKWVGERLALEAGRKGMPVALYRLGRIGGDSASGGANESDYCMLILKGMVSLENEASILQHRLSLIFHIYRYCSLCRLSPNGLLPDWVQSRPEHHSRRYGCPGDCGTRPGSFFGRA